MPEVDGSLKGFGLSFKDFKANLKTIITSPVHWSVDRLPSVWVPVFQPDRLWSGKEDEQTSEKFGTGIDDIWQTRLKQRRCRRRNHPDDRLCIPWRCKSTVMLMSATDHSRTAGRPMFIKNNPPAKLDLKLVLVSVIPIFVTELFTKRQFPNAIKGSVPLPLQRDPHDLVLGAYSASTSDVRVFTWYWYSVPLVS